uniref:Reverse transcriptase RNase H-like domain-containing protein n=1 Tax=Fagus sylvatica TaxID=28930 RepID=A0A2N9G5W9_FAGSY
MEGTHHNEGTSTDPLMTPIERQMQVIATSIQDLAREMTRQNKELWHTIRKGPPTPHDDNQPPPQRENRIDDQEADSRQIHPFILRIANFPLPSRFKVPPLENFDGTKDPFDYLEAFKTIMQLQALLEEIMCWAFPMGLRGSARTPKNPEMTPLQRDKKMLKIVSQKPAKQKVPKFSETPKRKRMTTPTGKFSSFMPLNTPIEQTSHADTGRSFPPMARPPKNVRLDDQVISFSEEDTRGTHQPHDDALVVTLNIAGDKFSRSALNVANYVRTYPKTVSKTCFLVVNCPSAYNAIIGRPTLNRLRVVTSTYHLLIKFPTEHGIGEVRGDQIAARECYLASLGSLEDGHPEKTTRIGASLPPQIKESLIQFLRSNKEVFAWSHEDMPGINPSIISHQLNVNPSLHPMKQKRRVFAPERNDAIMEEVDKLLMENFIREVFYLRLASKRSHGYNQIMMDENYQEKTSFITSRGLFCYKVMSFGLKNARSHLPKTHEQNVPQPDWQEMSNPSKQGEELYLYLAVSLTAVSSALVREEDRRQLPVYYTSRALRGAEERYPPMEKLAFALLTAVRKLRPYFQAHTALVDFIAEFTSKDDEPTDKEENRASRWTIHTDGSSTKNARGVGLKMAKTLGATELDVHSDSQLVVGQVNGDYEAKKE